MTTPQGSPVPEPEVAGASEPETAPATTSRPVRVRTVVLGLLLGLVALIVVLAETTDWQVDGAAVAIAAVIGAGLLLLGGAVAAVARERRAS